MGAAAGAGHSCVQTAVLRLMRQADLLAPSRVPHVVGRRVHDGTITTERPNQMWGTAATSTMTQQDGRVTVFSCFVYIALLFVAAQVRLLDRCDFCVIEGDRRTPVSFFTDEVEFRRRLMTT